jgi:phage terminase large subunit-like protein
MLATRHADLALYGVQDDFVFDTHRFSAFVGGVGSGKTLGGAAKALVQHLGRPRLGLVVAPTYPMLRDATWRTALAVWAPLAPTIHRNEMRLTLTTGAEVLFRSADQPDRLRGPNCSWAWIDEGALCTPDTWPIVLGRLREAGEVGAAWVTSTPRGRNWIYQVFVTQASAETALYRATTGGNPFVDPAFVQALRGQYTARLARQELEGDWLEDVEGSLWTWAMLEHRRAAPDLRRCVIGVDPAATSGESADETGIIAAGLGVDGHAYVLGDRSCKLSPDGWARRVIQAFDDFAADRVVVEVNNGGDMVTHTLRTIRPNLPIVSVHASRGKAIRAEPVAALYEQGRVHHTAAFPELEAQLTSWTPESGQSPDRLDALVWALTHLLVTPRQRWGAV